MKNETEYTVMSKTRKNEKTFAHHRKRGVNIAVKENMQQLKVYCQVYDLFFLGFPILFYVIFFLAFPFVEEVFRYMSLFSDYFSSLI